MKSLGDVLEKAFGELRFYAALGDKPFAEITIEEDVITIKIINVIVTIEALIEHIFRKKRLASYKLKYLKDAGYRIKIKYRGIEFEI